MTRPAVRVCALAFVLGLATASSAFAAADTVNLKRFDRAVSGTVPGFTGSVTVDLLRNTIDVNGASLRQQVDTFMATVDGAGNWSGAFSKHAFSTANDQ